MLKKALVFLLSRTKLYLLFTSLLVFALNPGRQNLAADIPGQKNLVPSALVRLPEDGPEHVILVDKSLQKVLLYQKDNLSQPFKTYICSTGENAGPKERQNDRKTPEGIYFFTDSLKRQELAPIYGALAFPIDYPNPIDKHEGKNGYGIWFHGTNKPLIPRDTNGCVAMENKDIEDLAQYITLFKTPAIIGDRIDMVDLQKFQQEKEELEALIEGWRASWEKKDIEKYGSYYSRYFFPNDKAQQTWKDYKTRLAGQYAYIRVDIDHLQILKNNEVVLAMFNQHFETPTMNTFGQKQLFLKKNSAEWKIFSEFFQNTKPGKARVGTVSNVSLKKIPAETAPAASTEQVPIKEAPVKPAPLPSEFEEIEAFIQAWVDHWQTKNLSAYISCYDPAFRSRGMDLKTWQKHRGQLNQQFSSLKVEISHLQIRMLSANKAAIRFEQKYRADDYTDHGLKNLLLIKQDLAWKIIKENWNPL